MFGLQIITCGKKLAHAEKLVGKQADYLHARASEIDFEFFISEVEKQPVIWDPRDISVRMRKPNKSALTQAKACKQNQQPLK